MPKIPGIPNQASGLDSGLRQQALRKTAINVAQGGASGAPPTAGRTSGGIAGNAVGNAAAGGKPTRRVASGLGDEGPVTIPGEGPVTSPSTFAPTRAESDDVLAERGGTPSVFGPDANAPELGTRLSAPTSSTRQLTLQDAIEETGADAPVLILHELTGEEDRQLILGGRALPFKGGLKFAGEMRLENTPYTGFAKVNQTVLGAQEQDTEMSGEWHDRYLGDPDVVHAIVRRSVRSPQEGTIASRRTEIKSARELFDIIEDMRLSARVIRVSWAHLSYIGRINVFEHDWQTLHDVKWKIKFMWIGKDEDSGMPSPPVTTLVELARSISSGYRDLHEATNFDDLADELNPSFADSIDRAVGQAQQTIEAMAQSVETRISSATDSLDGLRRMTTLAALARDQAQDVIDELDGTVAAAMLMKKTAVDIARTAEGIVDGSQDLEDLIDIDPGDSIAAACQQFGAIRAARALKHIAARRRSQALRTLDEEVIAIVSLRDGQDLRDVATEWYGSPTDWDQIRRFNGFVASTAPAGTLVFVPSQRQS